MTKLKGTPHTMLESIQNGVEDWTTNGGCIDVVVQNHVRDFLSQHFSSAMLGDKTLTELWKRIIEQPVKMTFSVDVTIKENKE